MVKQGVSMGWPSRLFHVPANHFRGQCHGCKTGEGPPGAVLVTRGCAAGQPKGLLVSVHGGRWTGQPRPRPEPAEQGGHTVLALVASCRWRAPLKVR